MGFDKPANLNVKGTLEEAIARVKALPVKPSFMIHTGDRSAPRHEIAARPTLSPCCRLTD